MEGAGRAATRSTPCASPWGRAAQPAGSIQSPPQGMLGEAARIRAAGCALPSPSNRGLKWVKEEGGGPGGLGEGLEELRRHPEGGDQGKMPGKAKPCVQWALGGQSGAVKGLWKAGGSQNHPGIDCRGALALAPAPRRRVFLFAPNPLTLGARVSPNPSASSRALHHPSPQPRFCEVPAQSASPSGSDLEVGPAWPSCAARGAV